MQSPQTLALSNRLCAVVVAQKTYAAAPEGMCLCPHAKLFPDWPKTGLFNIRFNIPWVWDSIFRTFWRLVLVPSSVAKHPAYSLYIFILGSNNLGDWYSPSSRKSNATECMTKSWCPVLFSKIGSKNYILLKKLIFMPWIYFHIGKGNRQRVSGTGCFVLL